MKRKLVFSAVLAAMLIGGCTEGLYRKGVRNHERMAYYRAIDNLERYQERKSKPEAEILLADSYRRINSFENAAYWYSRALVKDGVEPVHYLNYAKVLMSLGNYTYAQTWILRYMEHVSDDLVAEMLLSSCRSVNRFMVDTTLYTVGEVRIPGIASAFGQVPFKDGIIFTGDKEVFSNSKTYEWTGRSYLNIYFSRKDEQGRWMNPVALKGNINGRFHEGPACFTADGKTVYFTRSGSSGRRMERSKLNENNLKIYEAKLVDDEWKNVRELQFNSNEFSCAHPCLSADGNTMFFVSDKPGGFGGADIYKTTRDDICWTKPENLGPVVNTSGNEMFPYMHSDGTFYFSSDAHNNLGGLDVFMTSFDGSKWLQVENLNYPLNSSADDFAFVMNGDDRSGYVSSNRTKTDKIYEVKKFDPTFILSGVVTRKGSQAGIDSAVVEIIDLTNKTRETVTTGRNGSYRLKLKPGTEYTVKASKPMYFPTRLSRYISTLGLKVSENFTANFQLDEIIVDKPIVMENIYYDLDKWAIRPDAAKELDKLVKLLNDYPNMTIELGSHTDSRASDEYNMVLSDKRAHAAVNYLVYKGIRADRLRWKAYGETMIRNRCKNGVACSEAEHQVNRRTEFKVLKPVVASVD